MDGVVSITWSSSTGGRKLFQELRLRKCFSPGSLTKTKRPIFQRKIKYYHFIVYLLLELTCGVLSTHPRLGPL